MTLNTTPPQLEKKRRNSVSQSFDLYKLEMFKFVKNKKTQQTAQIKVDFPVQRARVGESSLTIVQQRFHKEACVPWVQCDEAAPQKVGAL